MFYYYFRVFNWLCSIFGMRKPFLILSGQACKITFWNKLWSIAVIGAFITLDYLSINVTTTIGDIENYLQDIADANDLIFNVAIVTIEIFQCSKVWSELYLTFNSIFSRLGLSNHSLRMVSLKLYLWIFFPTAIFLPSIMTEIFIPKSPQYVLFIKVPGYLSMMHLMVHLSLVVAVLKTINKKLTNATPFSVKKPDLAFFTKESSVFWYFFNTDVVFMTVDELSSDFSMHFLCKIYDDLITCIKLLEKLHGKQVLCTIWMMFSGAVIGATLISREETAYPWMIIMRMVQPFLWFSLCCFVDDQLRKEVEWTEVLIMKHLIDFKCDLPRKRTLEMFKQLVSTNRLEFTAGNLFHLNYYMILGTIMNVITYSIILVQFFISTTV